MDVLCIYLVIIIIDIINVNGDDCFAYAADYADLYSDFPPFLLYKYLNLLIFSLNSENNYNTMYQHSTIYLYIYFVEYLYT